MQKKVLIVEDEESLLKLESILLTTKGYLVQGVTSGLAALEAIDEEMPDLVLLDVMLPKMDGFETTRRIRNSEDPKIKGIPVIAVTANAAPGQLEKCREAGMDDLITKPIDEIELIEKICSWTKQDAKIDMPRA